MIHLKGLAEDKSKDMLTLVDARQWPLSRNRRDMFAQLSPHTTKNSDITYKEFLRIVAVDESSCILSLQTQWLGKEGVFTRLIFSQHLGSGLV